jgi:hypothetical protein
MDVDADDADGNTQPHAELATMATTRVVGSKTIVEVAADDSTVVVITVEPAPPNP